VSSEGSPTQLRLNHFLSRAGVASRRGAEALIREGRVMVNGSVVTDLATTVNPGRDSVKVDGKRASVAEQYHYFALYKPKETVSTLEDPEGRPCLKALLPKGISGLFPVGRLDYHSEGLILLTNDGDLANRLIHPRYKVVKVYNVKVKGDPPVPSLDRLRRGVVLEGRRTLPVQIRRIPSRETRHTWVEVRMTEGRKNQIREMFFRIEHPVIKLKRVAVGPVTLGQMKPGDVRPLTPEEVFALRQGPGAMAEKEIKDQRGGERRRRSRRPTDGGGKPLRREDRGSARRDKDTGRAGATDHRDKARSRNRDGRPMRHLPPETADGKPRRNGKSPVRRRQQQGEDKGVPRRESTRHPKRDAKGSRRTGKPPRRRDKERPS
jgi:23S rRNA pseudouridine2605 synthase